jgi:hypothetical protein
MFASWQCAGLDTGLPDARRRYDPSVHPENIRMWVKLRRVFPQERHLA